MSPQFYLYQLAFKPKFALVYGAKDVINYPLADFYTPKKVADILGINVGTVYALIRTGKLSAIKFGYRSVRIDGDSLDHFIESSKLDRDNR